MARIESVLARDIRREQQKLAECAIEELFWRKLMLEEEEILERKSKYKQKRLEAVEFLKSLLFTEPFLHYGKNAKIGSAYRQHIDEMVHLQKDTNIGLRHAIACVMELIRDDDTWIPHAKFRQTYYAHRQSFYHFKFRWLKERISYLKKMNHARPSNVLNSFDKSARLYFEPPHYRMVDR